MKSASERYYPSRAFSVSRIPWDLSALCREHQLDQFFGDLRLKTFGVSFVDADHVGDHHPVFAIRIDEDLRSSRRGQKSPGWIGRILTRAVVDVAGLRVYDLRWFTSGAAS